MTGTGASVFLACDSYAQAQNVLSGLPIGQSDSHFDAAVAFVAKGIDSIDAD